MDTSPEYIKMCEKAQEIQEAWETLDGDFYSSLRETGVLSTGLNQLSHALGNRLKREAIWLPRQDQLQEMVIRKIISDTDGGFQERGATLLLPGLFSRFINEPYADHFPTNWFDSMEQLWLAFVMKERYQKHWTGEEWEHD